MPRTATQSSLVRVAIPVLVRGARCIGELPGQRYLLITLQPAQAHDSSDRSTVTRLAPALGYPVLKGYALVGDFEGVFTLALGLGGPASIRMGELPGHWYIDVRT